jgi:hypothetical protein
MIIKHLQRYIFIVFNFRDRGIELHLYDMTKNLCRMPQCTLAAVATEGVRRRSRVRISGNQHGGRRLERKAMVRQAGDTSTVGDARQLSAIFGDQTLLFSKCIYISN